MTPLADGCSANDYSKKALAFLVNINPNLPQPYESKDVATYLIQLMPKSLRESGRRIKTDLTAAGRLEDAGSRNVDKALIGQLSPLGKLSPTMESQRKRENIGCRTAVGTMSMTGAPE